MNQRLMQRGFYFPLFAFAHRFSCASEILFRAAADIFRFRTPLRFTTGRRRPRRDSVPGMRRDSPPARERMAALS